MSDKLLSIVVPTYNIAQYIDKCIESFKQVDKKYYSTFEVIVVNDGSTDNSLQIVEGLIADTQLDIRVITKANGGHGSTINVGINEATGKFFKVIDGDDWIDVSNFEIFIKKLEKADVDLVITDYTEQHIYNQTEKKITFSDELEINKVYSGLPSKRIPMHAVTFKTELLKENKISISENTFYVDMEYTLLPLQYVGNFIYFDLDIYQYFLGRPDQSMNLNVMRAKSEHHLRVTKKILDYYNMIRFNKALEPVVNEGVTYLINKQCQLFIMNDSVENIYELFKYGHNCNYKWKFDVTKKTVSLIYINFKLNNIFDFIVTPLINRQQKEWSERNEY
jgi:putative glycosyltransferase